MSSWYCINYTDQFIRLTPKHIMKLNKQEAEDSNSPVWQQLLPGPFPGVFPSSSAIATDSSGDVRINLTVDEPANVDDKRRKSTASFSWNPFAPSWSERQRIKNGEQDLFQAHGNGTTSSVGSTDGDFLPKLPLDSGSSSTVMRSVSTFFIFVFVFD